MIWHSFEILVQLICLTFLSRVISVALRARMFGEGRSSASANTAAFYLCVCYLFWSGMPNLQYLERRGNQFELVDQLEHRVSSSSALWLLMGDGQGTGRKQPCCATRWYRKPFLLVPLFNWKQKFRQLGRHCCSFNSIYSRGIFSFRQSEYSNFYRRHNNI